MPLDEIAGAVIGEVVGAAAGVVIDVSMELIFNKYVARYFHGVGRHTIMLLTLGLVRIPSSLRVVPKGAKPKPTWQDWVALLVGIAVWGTAASAVIIALF